MIIVVALPTKPQGQKWYGGRMPNRWLLRLSRADEQRQGTCRGEDATGMMISLMRYSLYGQRIFTNFIS
jgi:hypothetical protein